MAAIDPNAVRATIEGRLKTEFDTSPEYDVVFHNMPYSPTPASTWLQCLISFGDSTYLTQGGTSGSDNRLTGIVLINIFSGAGVGPGANLTVGKRVRDLYNRVNVSGVRFDPPTGPEVFLNGTPEGYFQSQVRMTFDTFEEL